jgi:acetylornithine/N-succinyldiaminopimelate aminotransferase|tara:strand:- start:125 stop:1324 length:1200 start_codon:yes stop_codon:yes gene_type:complete
MISQKELFYSYLAQTSPEPMELEIIKAEGLYLIDKNNKKYLDLISGISVSNVGHSHPEIVNAVKEQAEKYMHLMVFGEYIQTPQTLLAEALTKLLPKKLDNVYFVNSGSEAIEGALKLAKRYTGRTDIISCKNAYHGSSHGALSIMGNEEFKNNFRPLLPNTRLIEYNNFDDLKHINKNTACIVIEAFQAEAGIIVPKKNYIKAVRDRCDETGTLLVIDEVQTGFGRTGTFFGFEQHDIVPDIITLAKGMGGGMPIGAFISSQEIMSELTHHPVLGHITTFGGHPVCSAASLACLNIIEKNNLRASIPEKSQLFKDLLVHDKIKEIRGMGFFLCVEFESQKFNFAVIKKCIEKGLITDWFLFNDKCLRISPPLIIEEKDIRFSCKVIIESINELISESI